MVGFFYVQEDFGLPGARDVVWQMPVKFSPGP